MQIDKYNRNRQIDSQMNIIEIDRQIVEYDRDRKIDRKVYGK